MTYYPQQHGILELSPETIPGTEGVAYEQVRVQGRPIASIKIDQIPLLETLRTHDYDLEDLPASKAGEAFSGALKFPLDGWATRNEVGGIGGAVLPTTIVGGICRAYWVRYLLDQIWYGVATASQDDYTLVGPNDAGGWDAVAGLMYFDVPNGKYSPGDIVVIRDVTDGQCYPVQIANYTADGGAGGVGHGRYWHWPELSSDGAHTPLIAVGDKILDTRTYYVSEMIGAIQHCSMKLRGRAVDNVKASLGCHVASATFGWEINSQITMDLGINRMRRTRGVAWAYPAYAAYGQQPAARFLNSRSVLSAQKSSDWYAPKRGLKTFELAMGLTLSRVPDSHDADGLEIWHAKDRRPRIAFDHAYLEPYEDHYDAMDVLSTGREFMLSVGNRGYGFVIASPCLMPDAPPEETEVDGMQRQKLHYRPCPNTTLAAGWTHRSLFMAMW